MWEWSYKYLWLLISFIFKYKTFNFPEFLSIAWFKKVAENQVMCIVSCVPTQCRGLYKYNKGIYVYLYICLMSIYSYIHLSIYPSIQEEVAPPPGLYSTSRTDSINSQTLVNVVPQCTILYCSVLFCTKVYYSVLQCSLLLYTVLIVFTYSIVMYVLHWSSNMLGT